MISPSLKSAQILSECIENFTLSSRPVVAVIMSVFDHWTYTVEAISSYYSARDERYHYILVIIDDCSADQSRDGLKKEAQIRDQIVYLRFKRNGGLTRLWNFGVDYAIQTLHADYIMLVNNDILISAEVLSILVDGLKATDGLSVIGPLTNAPGLHEKTQDIRTVLPDYLPSHSLQDIETTSQKIRQNSLKPVKGINGFFWGGHRDVFIKNSFWKLGSTTYYFNPFYKNFGNEVEFQRRLFKKGGKAVLASNAFVFHYKDISMQRAKAGRINPQWIYRPSS